MSIRAKIFAGCLSLILSTLILGLYSHQAERNLGQLATSLYDDAFLGMSYLRSAQIGFVHLRAGGAVSDDAIADVLDDLTVAQDRAMTAASSDQVSDLRTRLERLKGAPDRAAELDRISKAFDMAAETSAADGYRYRRNVSEVIDRQVHRGLVILGASLVASFLICLTISSQIARPIRRAVAVAQSIAAGRLDNTISRKGSGETADLLRALDTMQLSIAGAMTRIHGLMEQQAATHAGELASTHAQMDAAVNNMNQGLCLLDRSGRLQVTNRRFATMFGATELGLHVTQALAGRGVDGILDCAGGTDTVDFTTDLADGRVIAVSKRPVQNGGWVVTFDDVSERRASELHVAHMARHDLLTGLPNRLLLREYMPQALARAERAGPLAAICMDLDRFKAVNDTLGHAAGDLVLGVVSDRIRNCTREGDFIVRLGGDEFAILQENSDQPTAVAALCRRLIDVVAQPIDVEGQQVVVGCSLGIALSGPELRGAESLLKCADLALYRAKAAGRGNFRFFEPEMDLQVQERRALDMDLRRAIADSQFEVFYQPLVQTGSGAVTGFEALLRWCHPTLGMISPARFIPAAEESGLIGTIGLWVLRRACMDAAGWPGELKVAVNLSPAQFRCRVLVDDVQEALLASGLPPERLELEITESLLLQDDEAVLATLHALRRLGVRISMDDFGTGYSSLGYLRRFPFDKIKIDQSFIHGMNAQTDCLAIVRAVIGLGRSLNIEVNAEGVETEEQFDLLRDEGCGEVQGFLFSRPKPRADVRAMIASCPLQARSHAAAAATVTLDA